MENKSLLESPCLSHPTFTPSAHLQSLHSSAVHIPLSPGHGHLSPGPQWPLHPCFCLATQSLLKVSQIMSLHCSKPSDGFPVPSGIVRALNLGVEMPRKCEGHAVAVPSFMEMARNKSQTRLGIPWLQGMDF